MESVIRLTGFIGELPGALQEGWIIDSATLTDGVGGAGNSFPDDFFVSDEG